MAKEKVENKEIKKEETNLKKVLEEQLQTTGRNEYDVKATEVIVNGMVEQERIKLERDRDWQKVAEYVEKRNLELQQQKYSLEKFEVVAKAVTDSVFFVGVAAVVGMAINSRKEVALESVRQGLTK